jgi:hypothetical protein
MCPAGRGLGTIGINAYHPFDDILYLFYISLLKNSVLQLGSKINYKHISLDYMFEIHFQSVICNIRSNKRHLPRLVCSKKKPYKWCRYYYFEIERNYKIVIALVKNDYCSKRLPVLSIV